MPIETFLEKCRQVMRLKHLSYRTEETYLTQLRGTVPWNPAALHLRLWERR